MLWRNRDGRIICDIKTGAPKRERGTLEETPMLYILHNRNSLAIAWNGRAPANAQVARWEVRDPRKPVVLKKA